MHSIGSSVRRLALRQRQHSIPRAWSLSALPHRCLHQQRPLKHLVEKGLGKFLPPEALRTVAVDYQNGLLERVNELVKGSFARVSRRLMLIVVVGTEMEGHSIAQTVIDSSTDQTKVLLFNHASQALNNHFFVECLVSISVTSAKILANPAIERTIPDTTQPPKPDVHPAAAPHPARVRFCGPAQVHLQCSCNGPIHQWLGLVRHRRHGQHRRHPYLRALLPPRPLTDLHGTHTRRRPRR